MGADYTYEELEYLRQRYNELNEKINAAKTSSERAEAVVDANNAFQEWQRYLADYQKNSGPSYIPWVVGAVIFAFIFGTKKVRK